MENIWGFLLQTLSVSLVAALLLLLKRIFEDKLSPRWQYGIWSLLALRILLPVSTIRYIILPLPLWLEMAKTWVEKLLTSAYAHPYIPIGVHHVLPVVKGVPLSVTDGLFLVYGIGAMITLLWYAWGYLRLRQLLRKGTPADLALTAQVQSVAWKYQLPACQVVTLHGLSSAFVCGVIHPVLVVPAGEPLDDKVILHELLHLKYKDALQSVMWCVLRALHWCNPFLQYVFHRIANDMESLCDQRVLERLEGEERREYGTILLDMANERYASVPGTTSLSNGGKNISRRIAAIVRFKKYPKGMALVSVCIGIILLNPFFMGAKQAYGVELYHPGPISKLEAALAMSRLNRCTTIAGAIDTYVKGLMFENGVYIAMASPMQQQEALAQKMRHSSETEGWGAFHLESGWELDHLDREEGYRIYNLVEQEDGSYETMVTLAVDYFAGTASEDEWWEKQNRYPMDPITLAIPLRVMPEGEYWVVEEMGERIQSERAYSDERYYLDGVLSHVTYEQQVGETGILTMGTRMEYTIDNWTQTDSWLPFVTGMSFDQMPKTDAEFVSAWELRNLEYRCTVEGPDRDGLEVIAIRSCLMDPGEESPMGDHFMIGDASQEVSSGGNNGWSARQQPIEEDWDGILTTTNSNYVSQEELSDWEVTPFAVGIYWNGELVDSFIMRKEG